MGRVALALALLGCAPTRRVVVEHVVTTSPGHCRACPRCPPPVDEPDDPAPVPPPSDFVLIDCHGRAHSLRDETSTGLTLHIMWDDDRNCIDVDP